MFIDLHVDTPWQIIKNGKFDLDTGARYSSVSTEKMRRGGPDTLVFALYLSDQMQDVLGPVNSLGAIVRQMDWLREQSDWKLSYTAEQAEYYYSTGAIPVFWGLEGGRLLGKDPIYGLKFMKLNGIKYLTLTHNRNTAWADSATDRPYHSGLAKLGRKVLAEAEKLGIYVDISHASDATAEHVFAFSGKPVLATHSACRALINHPRNLTDEQIRCVAASGGVIGVPFAKNFLGNYNPVDHMEHIISLVGPKHVAIGSDIDGAKMVAEVRDIADWRSVVIAALNKRGYSDEEINAIAGGNVTRLFA